MRGIKGLIRTVRSYVSHNHVVVDDGDGDDDSLKTPECSTSGSARNRARARARHDAGTRHGKARDESYGVQLRSSHGHHVAPKTEHSEMVGKAAAWLWYMRGNGNWYNNNNCNDLPSSLSSLSVDRERCPDVPDSWPAGHGHRTRKESRFKLEALATIHHHHHHHHHHHLAAASANMPSTTDIFGEIVDEIDMNHGQFNDMLIDMNHDQFNDMFSPPESKDPAHQVVVVRIDGRLTCRLSADPRISSPSTPRTPLSRPSEPGGSKLDFVVTAICGGNDRQCASSSSSSPSSSLSSSSSLVRWRRLDSHDYELDAQYNSSARHISSSHGLHRRRSRIICGDSQHHLPCHVPAYSSEGEHDSHGITHAGCDMPWHIELSDDTDHDVDSHHNEGIIHVKNQHCHEGGEAGLEYHDTDHDVDSHHNEGIIHVKNQHCHEGDEAGLEYHGFSCSNSSNSSSSSVCSSSGDGVRGIIVSALSDNEYSSQMRREWRHRQSSWGPSQLVMCARDHFMNGVKKAASFNMSRSSTTSENECSSHANMAMNGPKSASAHPYWWHCRHFLPRSRYRRRRVTAELN